MTSLERVQKTLNHEEPDRVSFDLRIRTEKSLAL